MFSLKTRRSFLLIFTFFAHRVETHKQNSHAEKKTGEMLWNKIGQSKTKNRRSYIGKLLTKSCSAWSEMVTRWAPSCWQTPLAAAWFCLLSHLRYWCLFGPAVYPTLLEQAVNKNKIYSIFTLLLLFPENKSTCKWQETRISPNKTFSGSWPKLLSNGFHKSLSHLL